MCPLIVLLNVPRADVSHWPSLQSLASVVIREVPQSADYEYVWVSRILTRWLSVPQRTCWQKKIRIRMQRRRLGETCSTSSFPFLFGYYLAKTRKWTIILWNATVLLPKGRALRRRGVSTFRQASQWAEHAQTAASCNGFFCLDKPQRHWSKFKLGTTKIDRRL